MAFVWRRINNWSNYTAHTGAYGASISGPPMKCKKTEQNMMNSRDSGVKGVNWTHFCHNPGAIVIEEVDYMLLHTLTNIEL